MNRCIHPVIVLAISGLMGVLSCQKPDALGGCTEFLAVNYNPNATFNDGTCVYDTVDTSSYSYPPTIQNFDATVSTSWSENWNDWDITINGVHGSISTTWANDWNDWDFSFAGISGDISTTWSNDWDDWDLTMSGVSMDLSTAWSDNWNDWDIDDNVAWIAEAKATWSNEWDEWDITGDSVNLDINTAWSNDWDDWDIDGTFGTTLSAEKKVAVLFVPVMISVFKAEGIIP